MKITSAQVTSPPASLTKRAFAQRHSVSTRTIDYWRVQGLPCLVVSRRKILLPVAEADAWVRDQFLVARRRTHERFVARVSGGAR